MPVRFVFLLWCLIAATVAPLRASEINLYSVNTGSFVYHLIGNHGLYTEKFENDYFSAERRFSADSPYSILAGTMKNSYGDRCIALGLRRDWITRSEWTFKGVYGYTGEFFVDAFSHCGDEGIYRSFKNAVGVGFAPYIYHAAQYNVTDYFGIESGIIFPAVFVISVQWSFR
ncbi:hypothetical protein O3W44_24385 [Pantoea sp. LMR881]|uniref:hypothetical protein n=1 Tax=Pantoea sp. LMR881 TaxID=3014336 RepID=UPI0022AFCBD2|nr:hypothetical protein [Pantoea sp. LMR881]MCZ4061604.1 hypothetical protein [Pantoea sp. LMR881]